MSNSWFEKRSKCPGCHSKSFKLIYESSYTESPIKDYLNNFYNPQGGIEFEYLENTEYALSECDSCGMIFQLYIPGNTLMKRLYEIWIDPSIAKKEESLSHNLNYYSEYAYEFHQIIAYFEKKPSDLKVMDFGMGWSKWLFMARAFGCEPYGTELSEERTSFAKSNGILTVDWDDIPNHDFDFINTEQVFEHVAEPYDTLLYLKSALKPDGVIKISVPYSADIKSRLRVMNWSAPKGSRESLNAVAPLEHINCFQRRSILAMAEKAGLKEVQFSVKNQYKFLNGWTISKKFVIKLLRPLMRNILKKENYVLLTFK